MNIAIRKGTLPPNGPSLPRNMFIYKIPRTNDLILFSPIALRDAERQEVENLGRIRYLLAPNSWHRLDLAVCHEKYPDALVIAPEGSREAVSKVATVNQTCEETFKNIPNTFALQMPGVSVELTYILPLEASEKGPYALIVTDLFFNLPKGSAGLCSFC